MNLTITIPETWQETYFEEWLYQIKQKLKESKLN